MYKGKKAAPRYELQGKVFWQTTRSTSAGASVTLGINVNEIPSSLLEAYPKGSVGRGLLSGEGDDEAQKGFVFKKKDGYEGFSVFTSGLVEYLKGDKNVSNGDNVKIKVVSNLKEHNGNIRLFLNIKEIEVVKPDNLEY